MWPVVIDAHPQQQAQQSAPRRPATPAVPVRIGDAERDEAVSALGDHFAAGRLTREELDERIDKAMEARYGSDLEPLFADLPKPQQPTTPPAVAGPPLVRAPSPFFLLFPLLLVGLVVAAVTLHAPFILGGLLWVFVLSRFWGRRWGYRHYHHYQPGPPTRRP